MAEPGGPEWWPGERPPASRQLEAIQSREPAGIRPLPAAREGLNLLGAPERDARPSWLAAVPDTAAPTDEGAAGPAAADPAQELPFWMQAAIRLGTHFCRIAASGVPPASMGFAPHDKKDSPGQCTDCCTGCGCEHHPVVDEYYFWLLDASYYAPPQPSGSFPTTAPDDYQNGYQDDYYDASQQQAAYWWDPNQLPQLLDWEPAPMVRLAWCRVHNGEFQQPRRSVDGVAVASAGSDLIFVGRTDDSLTFQVTNPQTPSPRQGYVDTSPPGFRYDLATDDAVVLPLVTAPPAAGGPYLGTLPAYPYFVYVQPGTYEFPLSLFAPSVAVATALRAHCRYEAALKWYRLSFDPLESDCAWMKCDTTGESVIATETRGIARGACCDSTETTCAVARSRSILLLYLEALVEWGDALMRRDSPEAFQQARLIFDTAQRILGAEPRSIQLPDAAVVQTVGDFIPDFAPLNPRLLGLYRTVRDRRQLNHACLGPGRLRHGSPGGEMPYFGDDPLREGWRSAGSACDDYLDWCFLRSPYRFVFLMGKAQELAAKVTEFGNELLSAFEKGDAEYLASLRAGHERELLLLELNARKDQWRDADWQVEALQKTKAADQTNFKYYTTLLQNGLVNGELTYQDLTIASTVLRGVGNVFEGVAEGPARFRTYSAAWLVSADHRSITSSFPSAHRWPGSSRRSRAS